MRQKATILFIVYILCAVAAFIYFYNGSEPIEKEQYDSTKINSYIYEQMTKIDIMVPEPYIPTPIKIPAPVAIIAKPGIKWKVPRNIIKGILYVETKSILKKDDTIKYVDRRRGLAGERGPTQIKPDTFKEYKKPGESLAKLERDPMFAIEVTERILLDLKERFGSWKMAVQAWNNGPGNVDRGFPYWEKVERASSMNNLALILRLW